MKKFTTRLSQVPTLSKRPSKVWNRILLLPLLICFLFLSNEGHAQQDPMYGQYMFNSLAFNPAYAGSKEYLALTAISRQQWTQIKGAPITSVISGHGPILGDINSAGVSLMYDKVGLTYRLDLDVDYSYRINFDDDMRLAFGLRGSFNSIGSDFGALNDAVDPGDPAHNTTDAVKFKLQPNVGTGVYFDTKNWYAGFSVPRLITYEPEALGYAEPQGMIRASRHYYFMTGYAYELDNNIVLKPSILGKYVKNSPFQIDLNLSVLLNEKIWLGASYRTAFSKDGKEGIVGMIEIWPVPRMRFGYAYEYPLTKLNQYTTGTHEIMIGFNFGNMVKIKTPRYF